MPKNQIVTNKGVKIGSNANTLLNLLIGANDKGEVSKEIAKIDYLQSNNEGIDIITDLSLYNAVETQRLWEYVLNNTSYMAGTVPIYLAVDEHGNINEECLLETIYEQCEKGVSIITIHPTANRKLIELSKKRVIPCTSRGGGIVAQDLICNNREQNIYLQLLDKIAKKCKEYNVVLSIGSTFRSGSILDALDETYYCELDEQLRVADYLHENGINTIIETPGHVDPRNLELLCKKLENIKYPIMPLGPMLSDVGFEEDDTVAVIGASLMGMHSCADILSIVTSREHLAGIPDLDEIKSAISKYKITKHIIDLYKIGDMSRDYEISQKRASSRSCNVFSGDACKRCGSVCPLRNESFKYEQNRKI